MEAKNLFPTKSKIAIIGKAPSSQSLAPYADPDWHIWTLSDVMLCRQAARYDVQFELHDSEIVKKNKSYWDWLTRVDGKPVVMREDTPEIKACIPYPKDEIVDKYGGYFTNTVSWMIALAIEMQPTEIGVYGIDMAQNDEYAHQRPSCEYFLGIAAGRGIKVWVPPQSDLLHTSGLYGFDSALNDMAIKQKARISELTKRIAETEQRRDSAALEAAYLQGALEDSKDYWGQWVHVGRT